jgi:hypothetical protein
LFEWWTEIFLSTCYFLTFPFEKGGIEADFLNGVRSEA